VAEEQQNGREDGWRRQPSAFQKWIEAEGLPVYRGSALADLGTLELRPWPRMGQPSAFVTMADQEEDSGIVVEIAPGGQTEVQHHLFESVTYIVEGRGATSFWQDDGKKQTVEWQRGSLFAPPLNCYYQHFNLDGSAPVRMFTVGNAPVLINLFHDPDFVFNCPYAFTARYKADDTYFTDPGRSIGQRDWQTNFIPDVRSFKLVDWLERGTSTTMNFRLGNNTQMAAHISEFPPGHYKKAHRHGVGAHVIILNGIGYSLLWFDGETERRRVDWKDGSVLSPKEMEYHQHFNTGPTPARYLALRFGVPGIGRAPGTERNAPWNTKEEMEGIAFEREDPAIWATYVESCRANGAEVRMAHPQLSR